MSDEFINAARAYIARGWRPIRLQPRNGDGKTFKHPVDKAWTSMPMPDEATLEAWWGNGNPKGYGLGLACGIESGIVCVDFDPKNNANMALAEEMETVTQRTPSGGLHKICKYPDRATKNWAGKTKGGVGIDVRTDGGQFVAYPTRNDKDNQYTWIKPPSKFPLMDLPDWVSEIEEEGLGGSKLHASTGPIVPGTWNNTMISIAGKAASTGLFHSEEELYQGLLMFSEMRSDPEHRGITPDDEKVLRGMAKRAIEFASTARNYDQTEEGQAELFTTMYRDFARYNWTTNQWMVWRDNWWEPDAGGKVRTWVGDTYRLRLAAARTAMNVLSTKAEGKGKARKTWLAENDDGEAGELAFARQMGSFRSQENVRDLSRKALGSFDIEWDTDPDRIGVLNGVVHLPTGKLEKGEPTQMISKHIDLNYFEEGPAPVRWPRFVLEVMCDNESWADAAQRVLGYSITGLTREQVWFLCYGQGSNGKSTMFEDGPLLKLLGQYSATANIETFTVRRNRSSISHDIADLEGKRFVLTVEPREGVELDEERMKSVTTGGRLRADKKFKDAREFAPVLKLIVEANHKPRVKDMSAGFWRRVVFWPFLAHFEWPDAMKPGDKTIDKNVVADLNAEREGILWWLVQGAMKYYADGLKIPREWREKAEEYHVEQDTFGQMIEEAFDLVADAHSSSADLYGAYTRWADKQGIDRAMTMQTFIPMLKERFPDAYRHTNSSRFFVGIAPKKFVNPPTY